MPTIALDPNQAIPYIPKSQRGEEDPVTVWIRPLNNKGSQGIQRQYFAKVRGVKQSKWSSISLAQDEKTVVEAIERVDNFYKPNLAQKYDEEKTIKENFEEGSLIAVTTAQEFFDLADLVTITEVKGAIEDNGKLSEGQKKTFELALAGT